MSFTSPYFSLDLPAFFYRWVAHERGLGLAIEAEAYPRRTTLSRGVYKAPHTLCTTPTLTIPFPRRLNMPTMNAPTASSPQPH
ncbi:hypothetical protein GALMADRAFT_250980 [Galerina marginata CBS 339.88]|uniref:Uncharacterized protein n=1 Tax=Galerina marginata (strain CBS 339.88) TaxID=685588 RepID=A0A067T2H0_GALM3|nr:hypothetical protein GALMADRAFT_250980 [Galerina marginata CBS 339.88]